MDTVSAQHPRNALAHRHSNPLPLTDLLRDAQENQPNLHVARHPSRLHANVRLVRRQVHAR